MLLMNEVLPARGGPEQCKQINTTKARRVKEDWRYQLSFSTYQQVSVKLVQTLQFHHLQRPDIKSNKTLNE
jgi:hypothetical protein